MDSHGSVPLMSVYSAPVKIKKRVASGHTLPRTRKRTSSSTLPPTPENAEKKQPFRPCLLLHVCGDAELKHE